MDGEEIKEIKKKEKADVRTATIRAPTMIKKEDMLSEFDNFDKQITSLKKKEVFFALEKRKELIISLFLASFVVIIGIVVEILF